MFAVCLATFNVVIGSCVDGITTEETLIFRLVWVKVLLPEFYFSGLKFHVY